MLHFKPLELEDKKIFDKYIKPYNFKTSEYSFTNQYLWRKGSNVTYAIVNDILIIKKVDYDGTTQFTQPIGYKKENLKELLDELIKYKTEHNMDYLFKDAEEEFVKDFKEIYGDKFTIEEDRDNADYIYLKEDLKNLSGKKFHGKRNHYNAFLKNYEYRTAKITKHIADECLNTAIEWCRQNDCKGYLLHEFCGIEDVLKNFDKLDVIGMAVYVNDKLSAFTLGEKVNKDMAIIHIEKADVNIRGLYPFINKTFVEQYLDDVTYINREQDLGIEGLRKSKLSYNPYKLEMKYCIR
ncbi:DUF2156 domain-containing protein [Clostridium cochlearium]|jgi:hypothetical protein|uniref:Phosphatidylglycerol lysyltransferase C-terminal domain-containing protein n=1 Tax=Clostridium cochlearium TaxID=1494 RepID=A0ABY0QI81_CLOCO|nr:DUF2156 domain-containing protein [Clostridium cochlearium]MBV1820993.1 DUF2156 domain-containing protein [Bacteroidales bacterium MSK.15.36]NSJ90251.1 DUF2156 domain-containing protein [Coprococcus sp. MSK.21.13]MBE6063946.1 DUF2156 domain-containing protein [Clostridium cochlearium]MBU5269623.1 DUF2156 domain-containing protein [Clostridium cochlearium]MCG4572665.1 DUF2156 domain-containing protein [Clostridium cochlearium]